MTHSIRGNKSIGLPVASEAEYKSIITDNHTFKEYILQVFGKYPEIFPIEMEKGFSFHDWVISSKQHYLTGESHSHWLELLGFDLFRKPAIVA